MSENKPGHCIKCPVLLNEAKTGIHQTANGCMCSDCYYAAFGEEIEQHPIINPAKKR